MDVVGSKTNKSLVAKMKAQRKRLGKTQMEICDEMAITQATVSRLERDPEARMTPSTEQAIRTWVERAEKIKGNPAAQALKAEAAKRARTPRLPGSRRLTAKAA